MGLLIVDKVIELLNDEGIRASYSYPSGNIQRVTEPVAAVSLAKADLKDHTVQVLVEILSPKESGGHVCQTEALKACFILEEAGAICTQDSCTFLAKANLFRVPVRAVFNSTVTSYGTQELPKYTVVTGGLSLKYVCGFSAVQERAQATSNWQTTPWEVTVEEFIPWGIADTLEAEEPFVMDLRCMGNIERFEGCTWRERKRIAEEAGIRQIRKIKATGRILTV